MNTFGKRLRSKRTEKLLSQLELADLCGWGDAQNRISNYEKDKRAPQKDDVVLLASVLGTTPQFLLFGILEAEDLPSQANEFDKALGGVITDPDDGRFVPSAKPGEKYHMIPLYNGSASMGNGAALEESEYVAARIPVTDEWIRQNLRGITSPENIRAIPAHGDSMAPTFADGDVLFVDTGITDLNRDSVYVLSRDRELFCKRIQRRLEGGWIIKSDNPAYDPLTVAANQQELLATLRVVGRVAGVWTWRGL